MSEITLRPMSPEDRFEVAELIYSSVNVWYATHGGPVIFQGGPSVAEVFYDVYEELTPGANVVAENRSTGRLMGSCFYHPREHHVSLGIMNVHPNYFGYGVGRLLLQHIIDYTDQHNYKALRLTQSALNVDSFSLYNKAGFVPRYCYQDMYLNVPAGGGNWHAEGEDRVREATLEDIPAMAALEMEVSHITREPDYRYCLENRLGFWHVSVIESSEGSLEGFMISSGHPAMNVLGPCVAASEQAAEALIVRELDQYRGRTPVFLIPMEKKQLVCAMYAMGARNCEMHFCQVRGQFTPFAGVNMPSFLPETG